MTTFSAHSEQAAVQLQPVEQVPFAKSARSTIGVEWELGLTSQFSGELQQQASEVLAQLEPAVQNHKLQKEFMENTVELVSGVCGSAPEAATDIRTTLAQVLQVAEPRNLELFGAGTHPFSPWREQKITDHSRSKKVVAQAGYLSRQLAIFGLHTHVGVESQAKVWPVLNSLLTFQPHLLALSASSPFFEGEDTGYATLRTMLFRQLPLSGLPSQFPDWDQFSAYVADLKRANIIRNVDELRWDVRPAAKYGTIEVRICDGVSNLLELQALSALTHCLVEWLSTRYDDDEPMPVLPRWYLDENKQQTALAGLDAQVIVDAAGQREFLRNALPKLLAELHPTAQKLGCEAELQYCQVILEQGASYERQRRVYREALKSGATKPEALRAIVSHLVAELHQGEPIFTAPVGSEA